MVRKSGDGCMDPNLARIPADRDADEAFGWLLIETPDGPDFTPAPPP
jgi:hypothetical protein